MAAEITGERLHPGGSENRPTRAGSGLMADIKAHKVEVIIGGATLLVTLFFITRGQKGSANPTASSGGTGTGNLSTTGSTSVSTDMLASALQQVSGQEQTDFQTLQQQLAAFGQSLGGFGSGASGSNGAGGLGSGSGSGSGNGNGSGFPSGGNVPGGTGYPGSGPVVQGNGNAITNALQARNKIGDTNIIQFFSNLSLPSWIGLQYVAENFALPWTPGSTPTSGQLSSFNNWLDSHGYRNASTNSFTSLVSSGTVPGNVQSELNAAYGG